MPSFKELAKSAHRTLCRCLATIILSFCGISSFGMISIKGILGLGTAATLSIAILATASTPAFADQASKSLDVNLTLGNSISVRILDSTATSDLSLLSFDLTPTAAGVTSTKRAIVDVSTSNITGYKLYVEANGKDHNNQYTTDLVQGDTADSHVIPTSTSTSSNKNFWNYVNPATSTATVVPSHGNPDQIGVLLEPTTSTKSNVDINVGVDTTITAGSYTNQLLFTAIANAESIDYTLYFDKNAPAGVDPSDIENFPVNQTASASATSYTFTIPDTAPTLIGYTFGGYVDPEAEEGEKGSSTNPYLPGENVTVTADPTASVISGTKTLNAKWTIASSTLTVDPNGGTWSGSTSTQTFPGDYGSTKVIGAPSANATYTISYNDNSQSATYSPNPPAPTSVSRPFTGWTLTATGGGSPSGSFDTTTNTYTYNIASDTLTAGYNSTSNTFTLPTVTKTGHTCTWHENSASGTSHASGETNVTITANTEFYAVCSADSYTLTVNPNGGTWGGSTSSQDFTQDYGTTKNIANPTAGPTYTIGYNMGSTGITAPTSPSSIDRPFTSWSLTKTPSGTAAGSFDASSKTYTYGAGNDTLTANWNTTSNSFTLPTLEKTGHTCKWHLNSTSGTEYDSGATNVNISANVTFYATCTINQYALTVNPNGGTWSGSTSSQTFNQNYDTTKTIANPTAGPTYTIGYNMGSTGITAPTSPTSVQRPFTSWTANPTSAWNSSTKVYTFPAQAGTLTANYNTTSNAFTLPALTKTGHTCKWHLNSTSGTEYDSGATNVTITGNATFYAVCTVNQYTLTVNPNGGTWNGSTSSQQFTQNYGTTKSIANPTAGPRYTISYNMAGTAGTTNSTTSSTVAAPTSPTSVERAFSSWSLSGSGSFAGNTYTYEAGNGTLKANYNSTSKTFTLPTFSKAGYTCTWNTKSDGTGTSYNPGATGVTITANTTFYGICHSKFWTISNMQEMTTEICSSVYTPSNATGSAVSLITTESGYKNVTSSGTPNVAQRTLRDIRDTNSYTVRKLADGNCWMTENLRLVGVRTLNGTDTDITWSGWSIPASTTSGWCNTESAACRNQLMILDSGNSSYGMYYNWYTATATAGYYGGPTGGVAVSICPTHWKLPRAYTSPNEFQGLVDQYNTVDKITAAPANFVYSGFRHSGTNTTIGQGGVGYYYGGATRWNGFGEGLYLDSSGSLTVGGGLLSGDGMSIRCIAR